ncbi:zinc finger protein 583-like [Neoarius graeffei]|uniref:zinc finger protein 583-like n=1 Tax=Neoarius graeffei TaxID=443677 RepID=UPI00298C5647|nr:zinc finger protein 583-like [Neoarius graeffei]
MGAVMAEDGGHHLSVKQEADRHHMPENVEKNLVPEAKDQDYHLELGPSPALPVQSELVSFPQSPHNHAFTNLHNSASPCTVANLRMNRKISFGEETTPTQLSTCSNVEEKSWHEAVKSLQTPQETSIFKSSEVMVSTQCLLELFQFCWLCHKECCITIEGNDELFTVTQDCQSCSYHRDWRSRPLSAELTQSFHDEEENIPENEEVFIEKDGSYLSLGGDEASLQEEKKKRKRKSDSSDEWEHCLDEEATDSDVSMDEDLFTGLKEDDEGKPVVWCTQCGTQASLSCSVLQHKKVFCCPQCRTGDNVQTHNCETLPVCFDDVTSFQTHAEQEHGAKPFNIPCQDCGKLIRTKQEHVCEHKSKFIVCPECRKRFLTEVGLKTHYNQLHSDYDRLCKYCLKVFKTKSEKLDHEQTHPKENPPYSCPDCPQMFDNVHKRNKHVKSH